jgi:Nitrile hydratase beta subunit, C-terminal
MKLASYFRVFMRHAPTAGVRFRYTPGDQVRIRAESPPGGNRTPHYIRGKTGVIVELRGSFTDPESPAIGRARPSPQPLYRMRLSASDVWPESPGAPGDTLAVEISEDWLEPASDKRQQQTSNH